MATGTNGIATWGDINSAFGASGSPINKCPTKSEILAISYMRVSGTYDSNQLVMFRDISKSIYHKLTVEWATNVTNSGLRSIIIDTEDGQFSSYSYLPGEYAGQEIYFPISDGTVIESISVQMWVQSEIFNSSLPVIYQINSDTTLRITMKTKTTFTVLWVS